ncbi:hypothetical protein EI94DRAFT_1730300 [Lactarius quietus]|nr:hypothetical protein EI94DRAFT_1730300 [Lactarius quietus]
MPTERKSSRPPSTVFPAMPVALPFDLTPDGGFTDMLSRVLGDDCVRWVTCSEASLPLLDGPREPPMGLPRLLPRYRQ